MIISATDDVFAIFLAFIVFFSYAAACMAK